MTFDAYETDALGRPVEMYEFSFAGEVYRRTSSSKVQMIGSNVYTPLPGLSRSGITQDSQPSAGEITVNCPASFDVASAFRGTIPSHLPSLTVFRKHVIDADDEAVVSWKGTIVSTSFSDDGTKAQMLGQTPTGLFTRIMPRRVFSALCQHQLYDSGCGVDRQDYKFLGVITSLDSAGTTLTIDGLRTTAGNIDAALSLGLESDDLDAFWTRGYVQTVASPGEFRNIVESNVGDDPNVIRIAMPFRTVGAAAEIEVFAGCNHAISSHCALKFQNELRFGGYPYVPTVNPFDIELDSGRNDNAGSFKFRSFEGR